MGKELESELDELESEETNDSVADKQKTTKLVMVPKVQNMDNYLMKHYTL